MGTSRLDRGCPIPEAGSDVQIALCLPDTWIGLVSQLLHAPTQESFWDRFETLTNIEAACKEAANIVGVFHSDECLCNPDGGDDTTDTWDFTASYGGWEAVDTGYGSYYDDAWHADIVQINANRWDARLQIFTTYDPLVIPLDAQAICYIQDDAVTHISASYASIAAWNSYDRALGEVQYGGDLNGWHVGPINPRFMVRTNQGISRLTIGLTAQYALDPTGVIDLRCTSASFRYFA